MFGLDDLDVFDVFDVLEGGLAKDHTFSRYFFWLPSLIMFAASSQMTHMLCSAEFVNTQ